MQHINRSPIRFLIGLLALSLALIGFNSCSGGSATAKPEFVYKDAPNAGAMAKIGDEVLTEEDLIGDRKLEYLEIKKKEHEFMMGQLNAIMEERLIGAEAKKAGLSIDDYKEKKVFKGKLNVTDAEYDKFVKEKKIPESQINPQIKERIKNFLIQQKKDEKIQQLLAKLTKKSPVEVYFKKPKLNINVELGKAPVWGSEKAPVTIVEFSDFQCPFCSRGAQTIDEVKKKYRGKVRIAFKHFPLSFHREAKPASEASMCVNEQSSDKFWKFHDIVFENQKQGLDNASLEKYAKESGADMKKFKECFESGKYKEFVENDLKYGEDLGVRSTPTFFINGELISGALPFEKFAEVIDEALAETKAN